MAETTLRPTQSESQRLYSAWRYARAQWELVQHAPGNCGDDLPDEVEAGLCDTEHTALLTYLLAPSDDIGALAKKLRVCRDERAHEFTAAAAIMAALASDAHCLAFGSACEKVEAAS